MESTQDTGFDMTLEREYVGRFVAVRHQIGTWAKAYAIERKAMMVRRESAGALAAYADSYRDAVNDRWREFKEIEEEIFKKSGYRIRTDMDENPEESLLEMKSKKPKKTNGMDIEYTPVFEEMDDKHQYVPDNQQPESFGAVGEYAREGNQINAMRMHYGTRSVDGNDAQSVAAQNENIQLNKDTMARLYYLVPDNEVFNVDKSYPLRPGLNMSTLKTDLGVAQDQSITADDASSMIRNAIQNLARREAVSAVLHNKHVGTAIDRYLARTENDYTSLVSIIAAESSISAKIYNKAIEGPMNTFAHFVDAIHKLGIGANRLLAMRSNFGYLLNSARHGRIPEIEGNRMFIPNLPTNVTTLPGGQGYVNYLPPHGRGALPIDDRIGVDAGKRFVINAYEGMAQARPVLKANQQFGDIVDRINDTVDTGVYRHKEDVLAYKSNIVYTALNRLKQEYNKASKKTPGGNQYTFSANELVTTLDFLNKPFFPVVFKVRIVGKNAFKPKDGGMGLYLMDELTVDNSTQFMPIVRFGSKSKKEYNFSIAPYFGYTDSIYHGLKAPILGITDGMVAWPGADASQLLAIPGADAGSWGRLTVNVSNRQANVVSYLDDVIFEYNALWTKLLGYLKTSRKIVFGDKALKHTPTSTFTLLDLFTNGNYRRLDSSGTFLTGNAGMFYLQWDYEESVLVAYATAAGDQVNDSRFYAELFNLLWLAIEGVAVKFLNVSTRGQNYTMPAPRFPTIMRIRVPVEPNASDKEYLEYFNDLPKAFTERTQFVEGMSAYIGDNSSRYVNMGFLEIIDKSMVEYMASCRRELSEAVYRDISGVAAARTIKVPSNSDHNSTTTIHTEEDFYQYLKKRLDLQVASVLQTNRDTTTLTSTFKAVAFNHGYTTLSNDDAAKTVQMKIWAEGFNTYREWLGYLQIMAWLRNFGYSRKLEKEKISKARVSNFVNSDSANLRKIIHTFGGTESEILKRR